MNRRILITGATGTVSSAVIDALEHSNVQLRALIHDASKAEMLQQRGIDVVVGDLGDPHSLMPAFKDIQDVWLLTPNGPRIPEHSMNAVWAARQADVERIVRLSALRAAHYAPTRSERLHALSDHEVEHSGLYWTVLRPLWFMQNLLSEAESIACEGDLRINMGNARMGMIDARDVAECAATILTDDPQQHHGKIYTLTGPETVTFTDVAEQFAKVLRKPLHYTAITDEEYEKRLQHFGVPEWIVGMLREYAHAYTSGWGDFTTADFYEVTHRHPRSVAEFIHDYASVFIRDDRETRET